MKIINVDFQARKNQPAAGKILAEKSALELEDRKVEVVEE